MPGADDDRVNLATVTRPEVLRTLWKKSVRKELQASRIQYAPLVKDPLEWLPTDWNLQQLTQTLHENVVSGRYRASAPEVVRAAKARGLTRPLAFLATEDQLLYKAIVSTAEARLLANTPTWTRPGRFDARPEDESPAESGWFMSFIRRQGQVWRIGTNHELVVETDIANYFPYVHLPSLLVHVHQNSRLDQDVVRVLEHMLRAFSPMVEYRVPPTVGLPQEGFDCSRVLAHTYLTAVDESFEAEGAAERYSRYMDDIVIGANSLQEALSQVQRVQLAMERIGLYPNTAKTRILPRAEFETEYMKGVNDTIGELEEQLDHGNVVPVDLYKALVRAHLRIKDRQPRAWNRVLRRLYSLGRRLEDPSLVEVAFRHLVEHPDSARHILDYLTTFRLTEGRLHKLQDALGELGGVYEDIEILAQNYLAQVPNIRGEVTMQLATWAADVAMQAAETKPHLSAAAIVTAGKFATAEVVDRFDGALDEELSRESTARQQVLVLLLAAGKIELGDPEGVIGLGGSAIQAAYLRALMDGESKAIQMAIGLLRPQSRKWPTRTVVRPRALFLAPIVASVSAKETRAITAFRKTLTANRSKYRDVAAENWMATRPPL